MFSIKKMKKDFEDNLALFPYNKYMTYGYYLKIHTPTYSNIAYNFSAVQAFPEPREFPRDQYVLSHFPTPAPYMNEGIH